MVALNKSVIDDIIKNWFPIVGILFVVAGMSYLFYEGVWQKLNETGRLTLGFLTGGRDNQRLLCVRKKNPKSLLMPYWVAVC